MVTTSTNVRIRVRTSNVHTSSAPCVGVPPSHPSTTESTTGRGTSKGSKISSRQVQPPPDNSSESNSTCGSGRVPARKTLGDYPCRDGTNSNSSSSIIKQHCSVAMSRTESVMVSSAGDVIVCRCRRSSTPFLPPKIRGSLNTWDKRFPCCDADLLSSIDPPWSPAVPKNLSQKKKKGRARTGSVSQISTATEFSTYEWEKSNNDAIIKPNNDVLPKGDSLSTSNKQMSIDSNIGYETSPGEHNTHHVLSKRKDIAMEPSDPDTRDEESSSLNSVLDGKIGDDLILSLPSFDYSHIKEGHNDMVPQAENKTQENERSNQYSLDDKRPQQQKEQQLAMSSTLLECQTEKKTGGPQTQPRKDSNAVLSSDQKFFHGVPLFLSTLSQVRITKVSANPLGAHVLMISKEALLFTYGLNHRGQLGIGFQSEVRNNKRGFHTTPTLITPLLENGGKAINCAAGVDHSLVVVATECRRLQKLQTSQDVAESDFRVESSSGHKASYQSPRTEEQKETNNGGERVDDERSHFSEKSLQYHQVYAFGRNNFMKLGLLRPHLNEQKSNGESTQDVVLPRRVGLHCTVWPQEEDTNDDSLPSQGVFDIAASTEHSSALVRRATGDVEVYMWGNASLGALGLPLDMKDQEIRGEIARKPSFKKKNISPLPTLLESLCYRKNKDPRSPFAKQVSLGPHCSFVVMSNGKCMSCGFSAEGMLGHGYNTTFSKEPCEVFFSQSQDENEIRNRIVSVSAGAFHALALSDDGQVFSWGINSNERLGLGAFDYSSISPSISEKKENLVVIEWVPQKINVEEKSFSRSDENNISVATREETTNRNRIALACAGYDSSFLVTESGQVLSFGKRSGRLGMGEISSNVDTPKPLYGGLHLFHQRTKERLALPT